MTAPTPPDQRDRQAAYRRTHPPAAHSGPPFRPVMFTAWNPLAVLTHPWRGRVALSADPAYREAVLYALPQLRYRFALYAWADCWATPALAAIEMARELRLDGWIGQAEAEAEAQNALHAGARELVGNASALREETRNLIVEAGITFLQEAYWGDSQGAPSTVSAMGIPARLVVGLYPACRPAADYLADMPALAGPALGGIYLAEGSQDWSGFGV